MRILHTSDLHGRYKKLLEALGRDDYDLWIDTGDFFPNKTRGRITVEPYFQSKWFHYPNLGERIVEALNGRRLICIGGNHDYVDLSSLVRKFGGATHNLCDGPTTFEGIRFAGFREIPFIEGEWNGEILRGEFSPIVDATFAENPDVLVTHAPTGGILDRGEDESYGVTALTKALTYYEHKVRAHFFGHVHRFGGCSVDEMGIRFFNGAEHALIHEL